MGSNAQFILDAQQLLQLGVGGGVKVHADKWRVVTWSHWCSRVRDATVFPFESEAECRKFFRDYQGGNARIDHPEGYSPSPPVRLPIYGERFIDRRIRELRDSWTFGQWLVARPSRVEQYEDLLEAIDEETDPHDISINELEHLLILRRWAASIPESSLDHDEEEPDPTASDLAEFRQQLWTDDGCQDDAEAQAIDAIATWFTLQLRWKGSPAEFTPHACYCKFSPITPWPTTAGVYFVRAGYRIKIGKAINVRKRLGDLQTTAPYPLELLAVAPGGLREESEFHQRVERFRIVGEWFHFEDELVDLVCELRRGAT